MLVPLHALEATAEATAKATTAEAAGPQLWRRADREVMLLVWVRGDHAPPAHQHIRVGSKVLLMLILCIGFLQGILYMHRKELIRLSSDAVRQLQRCQPPAVHNHDPCIMIVSVPWTSNLLCFFQAVASSFHDWGCAHADT